MNNIRRIFLIPTLLSPVTMLAGSAAWAGELAATIFSYDGADFVRTQTTLTQNGQSEAGTRLDRNSAAYKALSQKQSYTGPATLFGHDSAIDNLSSAAPALFSSPCAGVPFSREVSGT